MHMNTLITLCDKFTLTLLLGMAVSFSTAQDTIVGPEQPLTGPGGSLYEYQSIKIIDQNASEKDGYWMFQPAEPVPKETPVVVFLHGYSAYNPMVYGKWIKHLVGRGNTVIFPRYQKSVFGTPTSEFVPNSIKAIKDALELMKEDTLASYDNKPISFIGHSFGGAIAANIATEWEHLEIPKPEAIFLVSPGTGPIKKFTLDDYSGIPSDTKLLIMVSENDYVVGDALGVKVFNTATDVVYRNLIRQYSDKYGDEPLGSGHLECYAPDDDLDSGEHGYSYMRAKTAKTDAVDFYGYWKLFDGLQDFTRNERNLQTAFGGTKEQKFMGEWSDGTPIRSLEVLITE